MNTSRSEELFAKASDILVGGVNSPVRAYKSVGGTPLFISSAHGSKIVDVDGNVYIDYVSSWGPLILGSAYPAVIEAIRDAAEKGTSYGASCEVEIQLAQEIVNAMPSIEMIRFVNSGTEACMSSTRVARAYSGRRKILKFEGSYHGHADQFLTKAGSGVANLGLPNSAGVSESVVRDMITLPYNDLGAVERTFRDDGGEIAAVIVEPIAGNMGVVPPELGFLSGLRKITSDHGALLIFDEVITGFRVSKGGAQKLYGINPDITCVGKIIGGGLPVGAYGGRRDIMELIAPVGEVYQAGTLSGNPLAMIAGLTTLRFLTDKIYKQLEERSQTLTRGLAEAAEKADVDIQINNIGSMIGLFFTTNRVVDYSSAKSSDVDSYSTFFHSMLRDGVYLPPSIMETIFLSAAHRAVDINQTIASAKQAFNVVSNNRD